MRALPLYGALVCALLAQTPGETDSLETMVVTGTRTETLAIDSPVRTQVVTREMIEKTHAFDVADALNRVPGLYIRPVHGKEGQEVWMQGFDSDRVLVLIDGRPVAASTASTADLKQISLAQVERIEIVKGATSVQHGSAAMGGVINIITRKNRKPLSAQVEIMAGSWGERAVEDPSVTRLAAHLEGQTERFFWKLWGDRRNDSGYAENPQGYGKEGQEHNRLNRGVEAGWAANGHRVFAGADRFNEEKFRPSLTLTPGVGYLKNLWSEEVKSETRRLGGEHEAGEGRLSWHLSHQEYSGVSHTDVLITPWIEDTRKARIELTNAEMQWDRPAGENHLLSFGAKHQRETLSQSKIKGTSGGYTQESELSSNNPERTGNELFVQDSWQPAAGWELLPGIRWQEDSDFGSHGVPALNVLFSPLRGEERLSFRAGLGSGYRVPTLKERFYVLNQSQHGYRVIGNEDLKPETSVSLQLGAEFQKASGLNLSVSFYRNEIENLIDSQYDATLTQQTGMNTYNYQNIAKARTQGAELGFDTPVGQAWHLSAGYTYLDAVDRNTGKELTERPEHQAKGSLQLRIGQLSMMVLGRWQSEEWVDEENTVRSPAYAQWDAKATLTPLKGVALFGGVDNIADTRRDLKNPDDLRPKEGRFFYAGLRLTY